MIMPEILDVKKDGQRKEQIEKGLQEKTEHLNCEWVKLNKFEKIRA